MRQEKQTNSVPVAGRKRWRAEQSREQRAEPRVLQNRQRAKWINKNKQIKIDSGGGGGEGRGRMGASCVVCQVMLSLSFARLACYHRAARPVSWLQMAMCWPRQPSIKSQDGSSGLRPTGSSGSTHPQCNKRTFEKMKSSSRQRRSPFRRRESHRFSLDASVQRCSRQHIATSKSGWSRLISLLLALVGRDWVAPEFWQEVTDCPRKHFDLIYMCCVQRVSGQHIDQCFRSSSQYWLWIVCLPFSPTEKWGRCLGGILDF